MRGRTIGYAVGLEQFGPAEAVELASRAEQHGFSGTIMSDRFQPWTPNQGHASFTWSVLGALGLQTKGELGCVTTPGFRMHPASVAQAAATVSAMYPDRHWLGIGSGELINEHVVGEYWPEAHARVERMFEAVELITKLFAGEERDVRHEGRYFRLESTRLWGLDARPPEILVAASGPVTARRAGRSADGFITVEAPPERLDLLLRRFAEGAREGGKRAGALRKVIQLRVSWAETTEEAIQNAIAEWPIAAMRFSKVDIRSPFEVAQMARTVREEDFAGHMLISADPEEHRAYLQRHVDMGFSNIYVHNVGRNQAEFMKMYGDQVIPGVRW